MAFVHKILIMDTNEELNPAFVSSFNFEVDIFNMNCRATFKLKDITRSLYNQIKTGLSINVQFYDKDNTKITYNNYMKVLSFNKKPVNVESLIDYIDVTLVSAWYFDNNIGLSSSYTGNYSEIVNQVLSSKQKKYFNTDISATEDNIRYRYRTKETEQQFLSRLMKYGRKGNLPVYLYMNAKGELKLRGIDDFIKGTAQYYASPDTAHQLQTLPSNASSMTRLRMTAYKVSSDTENTNSRTTTRFTTKNFKLTSTPESELTLNNTEIMNSQSLDYTPSVFNFYGWNITPDDAVSIAAKVNFEKNIYTYSVTCVIPTLLLNLDLGDKIKVYLPFNPVQGRKAGTITNLGEGEYFIKNINYIMNDDQYKTRLVLIQAAY